MRLRVWIILGTLPLTACFTSEKPYTHYLLDPKVVIDRSLTETGDDQVFRRAI